LDLLASAWPLDSSHEVWAKSRFGKIFSAISFLVYASAVCQVTVRYKLPSVDRRERIDRIRWSLPSPLKPQSADDHPHRSGRPGKNQMA
jgi:hypothetical protein